MARIRGTCAGNLLVALGVLVLLSGCSGKPSSSVPSEADGRKAVENTISQSSHGLIRLLSFAKTNGKAGEVSGVKSYEMEYRAELEFLGDASYGSNFVADPPGPNPRTWYELNSAHRGERRQVTGTIDFEQTEKGWVVSDLKALESSIVASNTNRLRSPTRRVNVEPSAGREREGPTAVPQADARIEATGRTGNSPPRITMIDVNGAFVGMDNPTLSIHYEDKDCDVVGGAWEGPPGSNVSQTFGPSGSCSGGLGVIQYVRTCQWAGQWNEFITLRDARDNQSARFLYVFECRERQNRGRVAVRVYNVDDRAIVLVNGQQVLQIGYGQESGWVDIGYYLRTGNNLVVFILDDFGGGWTYGFQLTQGGNTLWEDQCGVAGSQGCSRPQGSTHAFYKEYLLTIQ